MKLEKYLIHNWTLVLTFALCIFGPLWNMQKLNDFVTLASFWLMFLILKAQEHGERAILLKLDELIRATDKASNDFIKIEEKNESL